MMYIYNYLYAFWHKIISCIKRTFLILVFSVIVKFYNILNFLNFSNQRQIDISLR